MTGYMSIILPIRSPNALSLPAGMGQAFAEEMHQLWTTAKKQLNKRFRSDHYQTKVEAIKNHISLQEEQIYTALHEESRQYSLALAIRPSDNVDFRENFVDDELENAELANEIADLTESDLMQNGLMQNSVVPTRSKKPPLKPRPNRKPFSLSQTTSKIPNPLP